jgi:hypothetical protein
MAVQDSSIAEIKRWLGFDFLFVLSASDNRLWNWGFNVAERLNDGFIFCTSNPFFERKKWIFFFILSITTICSSIC